MKVIDLPASDAVIDRVVPLRLAVTVEGLGGTVPSSMFWKRALISFCLQDQLALLVTFEPLTKVKGSGRRVLLTVTTPGSAGHTPGSVGVEVGVGLLVIVVVGVTVGVGTEVVVTVVGPPG